jgi:uncharacterized protein (DUF362 family)
LVGRVLWLWRYFLLIVLRNRFSIAIASLIWLVWRSGTQPRRLGYPCQQAAAANLGFLSILFIPGLAKWRQARAATPRQRAVAIATGSVCLAGMLFLLVSSGMAVYSQYKANDPGQMPAADASAGTGVPTTVAIVRQSPVTDINAMVRQAVSLAGGLGSVIQPGDSVVLKPNLVEAGYSGTSGVVTDPRVVAAVVALAKEAGAGSVTIADGTSGSTWNAFRDAGYDANGDHKFDLDASVSLYDLNDTGGIDQYDPNKVTLVTIPNGVIRTQYWVPRLLMDCDVLISVPVFKNHYNGMITLSLKNRVGCAPQDLYYHPDYVGRFKWGLVHTTAKFPCSVAPCPSASAENEIVQRTLVDLNLVRPQDFVVVDAQLGMTNGPVSGSPQYASPRMQMAMAGRDSLAVDTIGALCMKYNPDLIPQFTWANSTNALGVMDRRLITVVGNHVAAVRSHSFPAGYAGSVLAETSSPQITGINITEGQTVSGTVNIAGSGVSDNVGVIKAELEIDGQLVATNSASPVASFNWNSGTVTNGAHALKLTVYDAMLNEASISRNINVNNASGLLTNGGFESGDTGWIKWQSSWGSGEVADFASVEPGHAGNTCLNLRINSGEGRSFGVYQEVPVTAGHTYKIDVYWKGRRYGEDNWAEVMLLDGAFDITQADTGGSIVLLNHMYAYDKNPPAQPMTADFGWIWGHDQNGTTVDTNRRNGLRTATGNTMTVVLKAGACCGTTQANVWFDEVSLVDVTSTPDNHTLTVAAGAGGTVTQPGIGSFQHAPGTVVNLLAVPNTGYHFLNWSGNTAGVANASSANTTITLNANASITANFAPDSTGLCPDNRVVNADFSAGESGWTRWAERGTATYNFTDTTSAPSGGEGNCARVSSTSFNGGFWQPLSLVQGQSYTVRVRSRDVGSAAEAAWAEVLIGVAPPTDGQDYRNGSPAGTTLLVKWDTWSCDNWNGDQTGACIQSTGSFVAPASTAYLCLKNGQTGSGMLTDVSWDNVEVCGPAPAPTYTLNVTAGGNGSITAPATNPTTWNAGTEVAITAQPAVGHHFVNWTGDTANVANVNAANTTVTMNADANITANFAPDAVNYTLTVAAGAGGTVSQPGLGAFSYAAGTPVSLVATASSGYHFVNWTGDTAHITNVTAASTTITMNANASIQANFAPHTTDTKYLLRVTAAPNGAIVQPAASPAMLDAGQVVSISAQAAAGYHFVNWTGDTANVANVNAAVTSVAMNADASIQANFAPDSTPPSSITEPFNSLPTWASEFNAAWGGSATWTSSGGGQSGNALWATRTNDGSSARTLLYTVPAGATLGISVYMKCPAGTGYWMEAAYRVGTHSAQDFDQNSAAWTMIRKFEGSGANPNGNNNTWTQYSKTGISTGTSTTLTIGFKLGRSGGSIGTVGWDQLHITGLAPSCGTPTVTCQNISRNLGAAGSVTVNPAELIAHAAAASGCALTGVQIRKGSGSFASSIAFGSSETGDRTVTVRVLQSDGKTADCTATVTVLPPVRYAPADFNRDGDVDPDDLAAFQACMGGANAVPFPDCLEKDLDGDNDVDQSDFGKFQCCLSGTDIPADPDCAD